MKANARARRADRDEAAGAEIIGAILLFGLFVSVIAYLNVTAVPQAGLSAEEAHRLKVLDALNALQASGEAAALPGSEGATVGAGFTLSPERAVAADLLSYFMASPALASGEVRFESDYGNVTILHYRTGPPGPIVDVGSLTARFPIGRVVFDPHPIFADAGTIDLENGGVVTTTGAGLMRFAPPIAVSVEGSTTHVTLKARVLNGTDASVGGSTSIRVGLLTESTTLTSPASNNARNATLQMETAHGSAWGAFLNRTATDAGLTSPGGYETWVDLGKGKDGLDRVKWTVHGSGSGNDVRLTTGLAVYTTTLT